MSKTPGREPQNSARQNSPSGKRKLSSDAKIIISLLKKQPQTKEEICEKTKISERTFYRIISLLEKEQVIKPVDHTYALWNFNTLEKTIEDALSNLMRKTTFIGPDQVVNEVGIPWPEIQLITFKMAKKLGLTIGTMKGKTAFYKTN